MSQGKYELAPNRQIKEIGEPCPCNGDCSGDLSSRNGYCTGQYEKCPDFIKLIEQAEERR